MGGFNNKTAVYAPVKGAAKILDKVNDKMFSTKALGDGFAIEPVNETIVSPVEGTVMSIFPTKHAISVKTKKGLEVLIHIGIDTVELNGTGFSICVSEGEKVSSRTEIAKVDFDYLKAEGKDSDVIVIFTNLEKKVLAITEGQKNLGEEIGLIK